jgi:hypothetical protein
METTFIHDIHGNRIHTEEEFEVAKQEAREAPANE